MNDPPLTGTEALPQPSRQSDAVTSLIRLGVRSTGIRVRRVSVARCSIAC